MIKASEYDQKDMQKASVSLFLLSFCIVLILTGGCTNQGTNTLSSTTLPTTLTTMPTATPTVAVPASTVSVVTTAVPATTAAAADPILHRWIRRISGTSSARGYELKFYPGGTVVYNYGLIKEVSSNMMIDSPADIQATGTWTNLGDNKYLVKVNPTNVAGAPYVWEYTYVAEHGDPNYPGLVIKEHIENTQERDAVPKGREPMRDEMFFPERAKID